MGRHAEGGNTGLLHGTHFHEYSAQQYAVEHAQQYAEICTCPALRHSDGAAPMLHNAPTMDVDAVQALHFSKVEHGIS